MPHTYTSPVSDATVDHGKPSLARNAAYNGRRCGGITSEHGPRSASHQATGQLYLIINEGCFCKTPFIQTALQDGLYVPLLYFKILSRAAAAGVVTTRFGALLIRSAFAKGMYNPQISVRL